MPPPLAHQPGRRPRANPVGPLTRSRGYRWGLAALALGTAPLQGQGLITIMPGAEMGAEYRGQWHQVEGRALRTGTDLMEWFQIPFGGQLFSPRLAQYRVALRPEFRQSQFTGASSTLKGRQLGIGYSADLLNRLPLRFRVAGGRTAGSSSGGLGTETTTFNSNFGATVSIPNRVFAMQAGWSRQESRFDLQPTPSTTAVRTAYGLRTFSASGSSSKTSVHYERAWFDDRLTGQDYQAWTFGGLHNLRWGKGSRLESGYERTDQTGALDFVRRDWFERLHLQHTRTAGSDLSYRETRSGPSSAPSRIRTLGYQFGAHLARGVSVGVQLTRSDARFTGGSERSWSVAPRVSLDLRFPGRFRFMGEGSVGLDRRDRRVQGVVPIAVVDEPHTVDPTRAFFLDQLDGDSASVQLRHAVQPVIFTPGLDFVVVPVGRELRVDALPGGRIQVGDQLLVSYTYLSAGAARENAFTSNYRLGLSRGGVRLEHSRSLRHDGDDPRITSRGILDFDETATKLTVRSTLGRVTTDLSGSIASRERADVTRREYSAGLDFFYPAARTLSTSAGLHWNRNVADGLRATAIAARLAATWTPAARLQVNATGEALLWQQSAMVDDRFVGGSVELAWQLFSLEAQARYEYSHRTGPFILTGHRVTTRLVRRI